MALRKDSEQSLEILLDIQSKLEDTASKSFKNAVEKLITAFQSPLFASLIDIQEYYELSVKGYIETTENSGPSSKLSNSTNQDSRVNGSGDRFLSSDDKSQDPSTGQPEWKYLDVVLKRDPASTGGFGFNIAGGIDAAISEGDPGIYVTRIAQNGCADLDGRLRVDDQILAVNGISLEQVTNMEAVQTLRRGGSTLRLIVRRYLGRNLTSSHSTTTNGSKQDQSPVEVISETDGDTPVWFEVELRKPTPTAGLGLSIAGGRDHTDEQMQYPGIFITRINSKGLAHQDGRIQPGDQLMQVNGIEVSDMTHQEVVDVLRNAGQVVRMVLARFPPQQEYENERSPDEETSSRTGTLTPTSGSTKKYKR